MTLDLVRTWDGCPQNGDEPIRSTADTDPDVTVIAPSVTTVLRIRRPRTRIGPAVPMRPACRGPRRSPPEVSAPPKPDGPSETWPSDCSCRRFGGPGFGGPGFGTVGFGVVSCVGSAMVTP